jgi:hypothetical protein
MERLYQSAANITEVCGQSDLTDQLVNEINQATKHLDTVHRIRAKIRATAITNGLLTSASWGAIIRGESTSEPTQAQVGAQPRTR